MAALPDPSPSTPRWRSRGAGLLLACVLIAANSLYALVAFRELTLAEGWVAHTQTALIALYDTRAAVRDAVIAQHDFLITGNESYRHALDAAGQAATRALADLRAMLADNPAQLQRLNLADALVREELAQLAAGFGERPAQAGAIELEPLSMQEGPARIRAVIGDMQAEEQRLARLRQDIAARRMLIAEIVLVAGTLGSLALIGLVFRLMATRAATQEQHVRDRTRELGHAVTALRQRGIQLRAREEQLRVLIESTPAAIAMFDRDMRYLAASQRYRDDYRLGDRLLIGHSHYEIFPEIAEQWRAVHRRCLAGASERAEEEEFLHADGSVDWIRWEIHPWYDGEGAVGGIALFSEVITARKQAEAALAESQARLRQAQKMEAVGQLTGGVAHDFNNMLGVIIGNAELLQDAVGGNAAHAELAQEILDTAVSGAQLTRRLLAFARKQPLQPEIIDLHSYVPHLGALLRRTLGEMINVTVEVAEPLWPVRADQSQVGEALLNLAINARDAMPHGGDLTVRVANARLDDHYAAENAEVAAGDYVMLTVTDTGHGMPPEVLERAIEPFFTTKDAGHGTGLGLSMIFGFAKQSGGHLKIYSEVGLGTTVRLYLPRAMLDPEMPATAVPAQPLTGGSEAILVVDDNAPMREVARRHLTALGYQVTTAETGPQALQVLAGDAHFDLLFTDIVMPEGMTGYDLAAAATRLRPALKVLFTTGYGGAQGRNGNHDLQRYDHPVIRKPYRRQELAEQLRAVLDGGG